MLRAVLLLNAVGVNVLRDEPVAHPGWLVAAVVGLAVWTALSGWWYLAAERRRAAALAADLVVAVAALAVTPLVVGPAWGATVPGYWVMAPMLAWAARWHLPGGLLAGLAVAATDVVVREELSRTNYGNVFLLVIGGPIVGYLVHSLQRVAVERDRAERAAAAAAERARLARAVHDGVLQVLALVQRRGHELGPDGAELAQRAAEQEAALRRLIRAQDAATGPPDTAGTTDLAAAIAALDQRPRTSVALPGGRVDLPAGIASELVAAVAACLDNVDRHAGPGASAWVLLDSGADRVAVTVRDDGPGIPEGRLVEAERDGRLGVSGSIRGRLADLGGEARLSTGGWGTEWELVVPR